MDKIEERIAKATIKALLGAGYSISVWEGEAYAVHDGWTAVQATDPDMIFKALASTEQDILYAIDGAGKRVGLVWFVWGNGEDLIADCSESVEPLVDRIIQGEFA